MEDPVLAIEDEVALEGGKGCSLVELWDRLEARWGRGLDSHLKCALWSVLRRGQTRLQFFFVCTEGVTAVDLPRLPEPFEELQPYEQQLRLIAEGNLCRQSYGTSASFDLVPEDLAVLSAVACCRTNGTSFAELMQQPSVSNAARTVARLEHAGYLLSQSDANGGRRLWLSRFSQPRVIRPALEREVDRYCCYLAQSEASIDAQTLYNKCKEVYSIEDEAWQRLLPRLTQLLRTGAHGSLPLATGVEPIRVDPERGLFDQVFDSMEGNDLNPALLKGKLFLGNKMQADVIWALRQRLRRQCTVPASTPPTEVEEDPPRRTRTRSEDVANRLKRALEIVSRHGAVSLRQLGGELRLVEQNLQSTTIRRMVDALRLEGKISRISVSLPTLSGRKEMVEIVAVSGMDPSDDKVQGIVRQFRDAEAVIRPPRPKKKEAKIRPKTAETEEREKAKKTRIAQTRAGMEELRVGFLPPVMRRAQLLHSWLWTCEKYRDTMFDLPIAMYLQLVGLDRPNLKLDLTEELCRTPLASVPTTLRKQLYNPHFKKATERYQVLLGILLQLRLARKDGETPGFVANIKDFYKHGLLNTSSFVLVPAASCGDPPLTFDFRAGESSAFWDAYRDLALRNDSKGFHPWATLPENWDLQLPSAPQCASLDSLLAHNRQPTLEELKTFTRFHDIPLNHAMSYVYYSSAAYCAPTKQLQGTTTKKRRGTKRAASPAIEESPVLDGHEILPARQPPPAVDTSDPRHQENCAVYHNWVILQVVTEWLLFSRYCRDKHHFLWSALCRTINSRLTEAPHYADVQPRPISPGYAQILLDSFHKNTPPLQIQQLRALCAAACMQHEDINSARSAVTQLVMDLQAPSFARGPFPDIPSDHAELHRRIQCVGTPLPEPVDTELEDLIRVIVLTPDEDYHRVAAERALAPFLRQDKEKVEQACLLLQKRGVISKVKRQCREIRGFRLAAPFKEAFTPVGLPSAFFDHVSHITKTGQEITAMSGQPNDRSLRQDAQQLVLLTKQYVGAAEIVPVPAAEPVLPALTEDSNMHAFPLPDCGLRIRSRDFPFMASTPNLDITPASQFSGRQVLSCYTTSQLNAPDTEPVKDADVEVTQMRTRHHKNAGMAEAARRLGQHSKPIGQRDITFLDATAPVNPWVKLNGSVNNDFLREARRTVYSIASEYPGILREAVVWHFHAALRECHVNELIDSMLASGFLLSRPCRMLSTGPERLALGRSNVRASCNQQVGLFSSLADCNVKTEALFADPAAALCL
eukprot:TRINITY_DN18706_c0_g1_i2.p1 TRINITY_DN18706_c0_g1~~TRINITY_DN18706_c0_g1_i2.p1  ORF type:complete len:1264 (-),score=134.55 TRINITY_DN18706_c0_g1_i2:757-4548(-)